MGEQRYPSATHRSTTVLDCERLKWGRFITPARQPPDSAGEKYLPAKWFYCRSLGDHYTVAIISEVCEQISAINAQGPTIWYGGVGWFHNKAGTAAASIFCRREVPAGKMVLPLQELQSCCCPHPSLFLPLLPHTLFFNNNLLLHAPRYIQTRHCTQ